MGAFDEIEVRDRSTGAWSGGFELHDAETTDGDSRFRVRRCSDGIVLPEWFSAVEVRRMQFVGPLADPSVVSRPPVVH